MKSQNIILTKNKQEGNGFFTLSIPLSCWSNFIPTPVFGDLI